MLFRWRPLARQLVAFPNDIGALQKRKLKIHPRSLFYACRSCTLPLQARDFGMERASGEVDIAPSAAKADFRVML